MSEGKSDSLILTERVGAISAKERKGSRHAFSDGFQIPARVERNSSPPPLESPVHTVKQQLTDPYRLRGFIKLTTHMASALYSHVCAS